MNQRENFLERAERIKITPQQAKNLVNLQESLRIQDINDQNLRQLRVLTNIIIPDESTPQFFANAKDFPNLSGIAYLDKRAAGYVSCELRQDGNVLYIASIGVLEKYRRRGIAGNMVQHVITQMAKDMDNLQALGLHVWAHNLDAIRLFERFGFSRWQEGEHEDDPEDLHFYIRPPHHPGNTEDSDSDSPVYVPTVAKKMKMNTVVTIGEVTAENIPELREINKLMNIVDGDSDEFYAHVAENLHLTGFAILEDEKVGAVCTVKAESEEHCFLYISALGVIPEKKVFKNDVERVLLRRAIRLAENDPDITLVTYYCQKDDRHLLALLRKNGFVLWKPTPDFYNYNTHNDEYYFKLIWQNIKPEEEEGQDSDHDDDTASDGVEPNDVEPIDENPDEPNGNERDVHEPLDDEPIVEEPTVDEPMAEEPKDNVPSTVEPNEIEPNGNVRIERLADAGVSTSSDKSVAIHPEVDISSLDVSKLEAKNQHLRIMDITVDTIEILKNLNATIFPSDNHDGVFNDVLISPRLTSLAFFEDIPCGFICSEKKHNFDGSSNFSIVKIGVSEDHRSFGIGGELLIHAIKVAEQTEDVKMLSTLVQNSNETAIRLFKRHGFNQCGTLPEKFGDFAGFIFCKPIGN